MKALRDYSPDELARFEREALEKYEAYRAKNLSLNMARGKPAPEQLDLSDPLFNLTREETGVKSEGFDMIEKLYKEGRYGKKTKHGFYDYE